MNEVSYSEALDTKSFLSSLVGDLFPSSVMSLVVDGEEDPNECTLKVEFTLLVSRSDCPQIIPAMPIRTHFCQIKFSH